MLYVHRMGNSADTIQLLNTFTHIADAGSLSAAARILGTTQASVSRQLAALEARFGVSLARRSTHELTLTDEGAKLLVRAREAVWAWEATVEEVSGQDNEPTGQIRVVAPTGFGPVIVAATVARFVTTYPKVNVDLSFTDKAVDLVGAGADLQVKVGQVTQQELVVRKLGVVDRWLVCSKELDVAAYIDGHGRVRDHLPIVALSPLYDGQIELSNSRGAIRTVFCNVRIRSEILQAAYQAVLSGGGAGLLPVWLVRDDVKSERLVRLARSETVAPVPVYLVFPPARYRPSRTRLLAEWLEGDLKQALSSE